MENTVIERNKLVSNDFQAINQQINKFRTITLDEMDRVKLMDRVDTKFVINVTHLLLLLQHIRYYYDVLVINDFRIMPYSTMYFDTDDFQMFNYHLNGKKNRYKIRKREYKVSEVEFLEIKYKTNKGRTDKKRIKSCDDSNENTFIRNNSPYLKSGLYKKLTNEFYRITLAHKFNEERVTIDLGLAFRDFNNKHTTLNDLVIIEVKQKKYDSSSAIIEALRSMRIRELRLSKYCLGTILLNPELKYNQFKPKLLTINKILKTKLI